MDDQQPTQMSSTKVPLSGVDVRPTLLIVLQELRKSQKIQHLQSATRGPRWAVQITKGMVEMHFRPDSQAHTHFSLNGTACVSPSVSSSPKLAFSNCVNSWHLPMTVTIERVTSGPIYIGVTLS